MTAVDERRAEPARPGSPEYEAATQVFNLAAPARPAAAVTARTVGQVQAAIGYARTRGLPVRVHATGHAAAAVRPLDGSVLIRTELEGPVRIDPDRRLARIPAGTRWGTVVTAAAEHGLAVPHGSSPTVGAVGFLLRGGLSFYGRRFGLGVNSIRAIEVVTADGELRRVDATADPSLFWALRGGGGGYGVVTAVEIELFPVATVITGAAYWPAAHAAELLALWRRWTLDAPSSATTSVRVMNLPPLPNVPPALAAGPVFCVDGAVLGTADEDPADARGRAEDLLAPLRAVARPLMDNWHETVPEAVLHAHMDPTDPVAVVGDHMLLWEIGDEGAAEFLRLTGEGSPLIVAGLRQLGGAYTASPQGGGALDHLSADYSYAASGVPNGPVTEAVLREHLARLRAALGRWNTGRTVPSFVEHVGQPQRHLRPDQLYAADRVRTRVDPGGLFRNDIAPGASAAY